MHVTVDGRLHCTWIQSSAAGHLSTIATPPEDKITKQAEPAESWLAAWDLKDSCSPLYS